MKQRCSSHRGDRRRYITRSSHVVVFEGLTQEHRGHLVPIKCAYLIDRNKYSPKTANRPKEAMKAARRARP